MIELDVSQTVPSGESTTAEWVSVSNNGSDIWSVVSSNVNGAWRAIKQTDNNTSSGINLFKADGDNIISVASGTTIVYVEYVANGISKISTGLLPSSSASSESSYISYGTHTSGYYGVTKIGSTDVIGTTATQYGGIEAFSIHASQSTSDASLYMAMLASTGSTHNRYIQTVYSKAAYNSGEGWEVLRKHGYAFAACTGNYNGNGYQWYNFTYSCEAGYKYTFEITTNGLYGWYDGVLLFEGTKSNDPGPGDSNYGLKQLGALYYVCSALEGADANGSITGSGTYTYNATSNQIITIVFRQIGQNPAVTRLRYASVKITRFVNLTVSGNGGTIGEESDVKLQIAPYVANSTALSSSLVNPVVSRTPSNEIPWEYVEGVYDSPTGGNMVLTSLGCYTSDNYNMFLATDASSITWYLHWGNTISYDLSSVTRYNIYCTSDPVEATVTTNPIEAILISNDGVKCASGQTVSITYNQSNGFTISSDAKYLIAPTGLPESATGYTQSKIYFTSPSGATYESTSLSTTTLKKVYISAVSVTSYGTPTEPTITQIVSIPASGITLTSNNVETYFSCGYDSTQTITYTNGTSREGVISYVWGGNGVSVTGRGIDYDENVLTVNELGNLYIKATGEGDKSSSKYITSARQEENIVTDIYIYTSPTEITSMSIGDEVNVYAVARYTSGDTRDIIGQPETFLSGNGLNISISNMSYDVIQP